MIPDPGPKSAYLPGRTQTRLILATRRLMSSSLPNSWETELIHHTSSRFSWQVREFAYRHRQFRYIRHNFTQLPAPPIPISSDDIGRFHDFPRARMGKMSKKTGLVCLLAVILLPPSVGMSQQPIRWETTLESAQRLAGQTNRLVLIHFWAPWCVVCKRMEADVLSQPPVVAELSADYVPVKINADQLPATAERYGVTALPTTAIVSPEGQLLDSMRGWVDADQYVARLNRVAADVRQRKAALAQLPSCPQPPGRRARRRCRRRALRQPMARRLMGRRSPDSRWRRFRLYRLRGHHRLRLPQRRLTALRPHRL